jgi:hypothetical protein
VFNDLYRVSAAKSQQGYLLNGAALPQLSGEACVVNDTAVADVDAVVAVAVALGSQMSTPGRLPTKTG